MMNNIKSISSYINKIPESIKSSKYPLSKLNLSKLEGIQDDIDLFQTDKSLKMSDISFITKRLETLNLFRGCSLGCSHCLKDAQPQNESTILFEDLERFLNGFNILSERLGFNVLNGNRYLNIVDDSNPTDIPIRGKNVSHSLAEAVKLISEKLRIPVLIVTSGWNSASQYAQKNANDIAKLANNSDVIKSVEISINPFIGILERSRNALKEGNSDKANFLRNIYTSRMANVLSTFLNAFRNNKAGIIYRHALNIKGNELVNEDAMKILYKEIYEKLSKIVGSSIENVPYLRPECITKFAKSHFIEASGRGRKFFSQEYNLKEQEQLIDEAIEWECLSESEKFEKLSDYGLKCVDIDGSIYTTMPSTKVTSISAPIELTIPTDIKLNYESKTPIEHVFSDIDL